MKVSTSISRPGKGQLKCFDCRQAFMMKEGGWRDRGSQQVFLCRSCDKAQNAPPQKFPSK